jgi:membrane dipeptidase
VVDAHGDLLRDLALRRREPNPFSRHRLGTLRAGVVRLQLCPVHVALAHLPEGGLRGALEQIAAACRAVEENRETTMLVRTRADLDELMAGEKLGIVLSMEGTEPFGDDPAMADVFWHLGVRVFGLTWNRRNPFAAGTTEGAGGLSPLGRELVHRLFARGAVLDLADASEQTFADVLALAPRPGAVLVSHAGCRAVQDFPMNLDDERLRELAGAGGVLGVMAPPLATGPSDPTVEPVLAHILHAVATMGADAVGLAGRDHYPNLLEALERNGLRPDAVAAVAGGSFLRLLRAALPPRG